MDRFEVQLSHLTAADTYEVTVRSNRATTVGLGACGKAAQTRTVTGATAQDLRFLVYACTVGTATLTAEVRLAGADTVLATVSQALTVLAIPEGAPAGVRGAPAASAATRGATRAGTPGIVPNISFDNITINSVRATWGTPSNGDYPLTGYGVLLWRAVDDQPPWDQAVSIGVTNQQTFTGLHYDTTYKFRIHACNETDSCGRWTHPPREVRTAGRPDPPHTIRFTNITASSARVMWSIAANTGGVPLTGIDLRYWPYDPANPDLETGATTHPADDGNDRGETLRGLAAGTEYELKMRACNGPSDSHCSRWSADHRFTTTSGTGAPGPVKNLGIVPGDGQLVVRWEAPDSDGGTAITGYEVAYRAHQTEPNWTSWPHDGTGTTATITGRTNGRRYDVRVRACNHAAGETARCRHDWRTGHGTPETPRPRNLNVVPLAWSPSSAIDRAAELTWDPVPGAATYEVQAQVLGQRDWHAARCQGDVQHGIVSIPRCVIDLATVAGRGFGLHSHKAYALQVRALQPLESTYSEPVVIIDTPIFIAKGASTRVDVTWTPIDTIHGALHANGTYQLRYRKFRGNHGSVDWKPETEQFHPTNPTPVLVAGTTSRLINDLDNGSLYAIQLLYQSPQQSAAAVNVFAARDAYAWPSDRAAGVGTDITGVAYAGERVGTFPLSKPVSDRTYEYYICSDTFPQDMEPDEPDDPGPPDGIRAKSRAFIRDAFSQWESATTTETGTSLIAMTYMGTTCADYRPLIQPIVNTINSSVTDGDPPATIRMHVEDVIRQLGDLGGILDQDKERSEVIFVDVPVEEGVGSRRTKRYVFFQEVSHNVAIDSCVFTSLACAADEEKDGQLRTDILFNGKSFENNENFNWDIPSVAFNLCISVSGSDIDTARSLYSTTVHEAGHALGIRGTSRSGGTRRQVHHSIVDDQSIMNWRTTLCSPTPFDVMAIYAVYQSEG